ncbi:hypothetical protein [Rhodoferax sp.]|uniref:hypothetical protein n=1 Tax=Rhodoferax sp. TaxID=50421 RepID=UPI00374D08A8
MMVLLFSCATSAALAEDPYAQRSCFPFSQVRVDIEVHHVQVAMVLTGQTRFADYDLNYRYILIRYTADSKEQFVVLRSELPVGLDAEQFCVWVQGDPDDQKFSNPKRAAALRVAPTLLEDAAIRARCAEVVDDMERSHQAQLLGYAGKWQHRREILAAQARAAGISPARQQKKAAAQRQEVLASMLKGGDMRCDSLSSLQHTMELQDMKLVGLVGGALRHEHGRMEEGQDFALYLSAENTSRWLLYRVNDGRAELFGWGDDFQVNERGFKNY